MPLPRYLGGREKRGRTSASSACLLIYRTHLEIHLKRLQGAPGQQSELTQAVPASAEPEAGAETVGKAYSLSHSVPASDVPPCVQISVSFLILRCVGRR